MSGILVILGFAAVCYILIKARPFKTCPRCRGIGHMIRVIGPAKTCRACKGTGLRTRRARRKARRLFADQSTGRGRR